MKNSTTTTMPFGRYKGKPVGEVPKTYLRWLHGQGGLYGALLTAVENALGLPPPRAHPMRPWQPDSDPDNTTTIGWFDDARERKPDANDKTDASISSL